MAAPPRRALDELADLLARSTVRVAARLIDGLVAWLREDPRSGTRATRALGEELRGSLWLATLLGRRRTLFQADRAAGRRVEVAPPRRPPGPPPLVLAGVPESVPPVRFREAISNLVEREPRLAAGYQEAARIYTEERGFVLAKNTIGTARKRLERAKAVRDLIVRSLREGVDRVSAVEQVAAVGPWSRAYADTVYRTNVNSAFSTGRFRQLEEPDVRAATPALRYVATLDTDVRPNHRAAHDLVAVPDDPVWAELAPPNGYNCRCTLELVPFSEARRLGVVDEAGRARYARRPPGAHPDFGFVKRGHPGAPPTRT